MPPTPPPTRAFGDGSEQPVALDESARGRAFEPHARSAYFDEDRRPKPYRMQGAVALVDVCGPLDSRASWWCDDYGSIVARARAAHADPAVRSVLYDVDSPGGATLGMVAAAGELRALAEASGKPTVAHTAGMACSAAYALAVAADRIVVTGDAAVGSIGVYAVVYDRTQANEKAGLDVRVVRSGSLKADPHPDVALTDASVARVRARVMELAQAFGAHVGARRPQLGDPLALQGAAFYGADAVARGLADEVGTLGAAITLAATLAAANDTNTRNAMDGQKALETVGTLRALVDVKTDEEVAAAVATRLQQGAALPEVTRQRDEALAKVAAFEGAEAARVAAAAKAAVEVERAKVIARHAERGALTEGMRANEPYMATLAALTPEQLDANLSALPVIAHPRVEPAGRGGAGGKSAEGAPLTDIEKSAAAAAGLSEAEFTKQRDEIAQKASA